MYLFHHHSLREDARMGKNNCCGSTGFIVIVVNLLLFGVIFLVAGLILSQGDVLSEIIRNKIDQDMMLKPGSSAYRNWLKPVLPIYMQFFVFNLTNPEEFFSGTEKPAVQQRGPYSYKEIRRNLVLNWSVDENEVKFKPYRAYVFDPETSCETCNDTKDSITTVNIPLMSMITFMESRLDVFGKGKDCNSLLNYAIDLVEPKPRLFHTLTVNDMIWGYTDPLLKLLYDMQNSSVVECPVPEGFNPFVQLQQNNSFSGVSVINSGRNDIELVGQYTMWKNKRSLSWWHNEYANMINGTDGTQTKPHMTEDDLIYYTFSPDICRSMSFLYEEMTEIIGIKLRRYVPPDESSDPDNNGFCVPPNCPPAGLLNISCCLPSNPPVVISPPHFYQCNKSLLDTVDGLHPSKDLHGSHIDVEPITGLTMNANKRIQFNIAMHPSKLLEVTNGSFNPVFLPVMYINEKAELDNDNADKFKNKVYIPILLTEVLEWGLVILGSVLIIVAILLFTCRRGRNGFLQMADEHAPLVGKGK